MNKPKNKNAAQPKKKSQASVKARVKPGAKKANAEKAGVNQAGINQAGINQAGINQAWGGRFSEQTDAFVEAFTASVQFDQRMYKQDIAGSRAHARMLA
ncbi:MAG: hypothetical protein WBN96_00950, partial [Gammaproteobacteria bacterium]